MSAPVDLFDKQLRGKLTILHDTGKDSQQAGPIFGYLSIVRGVAAITGPLLAGLLFDPTSTKNASWGRYGLGSFVLFVGCMSIAAAGGSVLLEGTRRLRGRKGWGRRTEGKVGRRAR